MSHTFPHFAHNQTCTPRKLRAKLSEKELGFSSWCSKLCKSISLHLFSSFYVILSMILLVECWIVFLKLLVVEYYEYGSNVSAIFVIFRLACFVWHGDFVLKCCLVLDIFALIMSVFCWSANLLVDL